MSDPVLRAPDFDKPFLVTTDASERGVGAVLMQEGPSQEFHPVVFLSKKLSELRGRASELRGKATGQSVKRNVTPLSTLWKSYAHTFGDGVSTCKPTMLRYSGFILPREITKKLIWWSLALQDFDFDIQHISGASNKVADALSCESFPQSTGPNRP
ncbi:unnamed protein product [Natator depressus]